DGNARTHCSVRIPDGSARTHCSVRISDRIPDGSARTHCSVRISDRIPDGNANRQKIYEYRLRKCISQPIIHSAHFFYSFDSSSIIAGRCLYLTLHFSSSAFTLSAPPGSSRMSLSVLTTVR